MTLFPADVHLWLEATRYPPPTANKGGGLNKHIPAANPCKLSAPSHLITVTQSLASVAGGQYFPYSFSSFPDANLLSQCCQISFDQRSRLVSMPDPSSNSQPTGSAVDADIASVRRLIDGVFSKLLDEERAARASYVVVQDQFTKNEQMIQQLQRENDAALNNKLQLRETWEAAREKRRQVKHQLQSMARENTVRHNHAFS